MMNRLLKKIILAKILFIFIISGYDLFSNTLHRNYVPAPDRIILCDFERPGSVILRESENGWVEISGICSSKNIEASIYYKIKGLDDRIIRVGTIDSADNRTIRIKTKTIPQGLYLLEFRVGKMIQHRWLFK